MIMEYADDWVIADRRTRIACTISKVSLDDPFLDLSHWLREHLNPLNWFPGINFDLPPEDENPS